MLDDGYTFEEDIEGVHIVYRPVLGAYRDRTFKAIKESRHPVIEANAVLRRHVVEGLQEAVRDPSLAASTFKAICWLDDLERERRYSQNLVDGVWLELRHPNVARRSCEQCKKWWFDHETGKVVHRRGKPLRRIPGTALPCETFEGCAKGSPEASKSLNERNQKAYAHYLECKATHSFPDDPIVRLNATVIAMVERQWEEYRIRNIVREELTHERV